MRGNYGMLWNIAMGETEHKWNGMASISIILFFILQTRFVVCLQPQEEIRTFVYMKDR